MSHLTRTNNKKGNTSHLSNIDRGTYALATISRLILIFLILLFTQSCFVKNKLVSTMIPSTIRLNSDILPGQDICLLHRFQGTSVDNVYYISWTYTCNTDNFLFQLESSVDGNNFKPCLYKRASISPMGEPIMYCVVDSINPAENTFYRLKAIPEEMNLGHKGMTASGEIVQASVIQLKKNIKSPAYSLLR